MTELEELFERLEQAAHWLVEVIGDAGDSRELWRLTGKIEGVRLAQSYIDEIVRYQ